MTTPVPHGAMVILYRPGEPDVDITEVVQRLEEENKRLQSTLPALFRLQEDLAEVLPEIGLASGWPVAISIIQQALARLACWRVWEKGGRLGLYHAVDGDAPTREEWLKIGEDLASLARAAGREGAT